MMFFGAFTLLVLPLFMVVIIQMVKNSTWSDTVMAKVVIVVSYLSIATAVFTGLYLFTLI